MLNDFEVNTKIEKDFDVETEYAKYFEESKYPTYNKLNNFSKYVRRQEITYFLSRYELFKKILHVNGSIVECGVLYGSSLMSWAQFSSIFEPYNHTRKIIGFDTFSGFTSLEEKDGDKSSIQNDESMSLNYKDELERSIGLYDQNRALNHINKVQLVEGDIVETIPKYIEDNPHLVISLLYLDVDIYKPTKVALQHLFKRMPKGACIVFDELNVEFHPGETLAVLEEIGISNLRIERFSHDTNISYAIIE